MIATDLILTIREREWLALMEERCRERGYVLVGLARSRDGLALGLGDIVLSDVDAEEEGGDLDLPEDDDPVMVPFDCPKHGGICYETACLHFNECRAAFAVGDIVLCDEEDGDGD